jgi:hypothetical protein
MLALAPAVIAQDVDFNFENDANFSAFETYAWVDMNNSGQPLDELTASQLKSAVEVELAMKGLQKADSAHADLLICYQVAVHKEREIGACHTGWSYGPGWRTGGIATSQTSAMRIGSVVLDIYLRSAKLLVWRGTATKTIDANAKPDKREKDIQKGIQKLLKNYPPPKLLRGQNGFASASVRAGRHFTLE